MALRLSNLKLRAIVVLVVSKQKGITLVFKNDPLESLDVSSTFDSIAVLKGFIQREIEGQLREMFREDLPGIIHTLSQRWFSSEAGGAPAPPTNVEIPRGPGAVGGVNSPPSSPTSAHHSLPEPIFPPYSPSTHQQPQRSMPRPAGPARAGSSSRTTATATHASTQQQQVTAPSSPPSSSTFPDIEEYDPTYGLRPEGLPMHTVVAAPGLGRLWERNRGLGQLFEDVPREADELAEEADELAEYEAASAADESIGFDEDVDELDDEVYYSRRRGEAFDDLTPTRRRQALAAAAGGRPSRSFAAMSEAYETIPAVGGGTVTRPRVFLSQSYIRPPSSVGGSAWPGTPRSTSVFGSAGASGSTVTLRDQQAGEEELEEQWRQARYGGGGALTPGGGGGPSFQDWAENLRAPGSAPFQSSSDRPRSSADGGLGLGLGLRGDSFYGEGRRGAAGSLGGGGGRPQAVHAVSSPQLARQQHLQRHHARGPSSLGQPFSSSSSRRVPGLSHSLSTTPSRSSLSLSTPSPTDVPVFSSSPPSPSSLHPLPRHHRSPSSSAGLPETLSHLSMLSLSNHTLSPYTREPEHVAVRSHPRLAPSGGGSASSSAGMDHPLRGAIHHHAGAMAGGGGAPRKAQRKRLHRLGTKSKTVPTTPNTSSGSPPLPPLAPFESAPASPPLRHHNHHHHHQYPAASSSTAAAVRPRLTPKESYGFPRIGSDVSSVPRPSGWDTKAAFTGKFKGEGRFRS